MLFTGLSHGSSAKTSLVDSFSVMTKSSSNFNGIYGSSAKSNSSQKFLSSEQKISSRYARSGFACWVDGVPAFEVRSLFSLFFSRRHNVFHLHFTMFSVLPGISLAIRAHWHGYRRPNDRSLSSSRGVHFDFFNFGLRWFVQRSRHCLQERVPIASDRTLQDNLSVLLSCSRISLTSILSSSWLHFPFLRVGDITFFQRCTHSFVVLPGTILAIVDHELPWYFSTDSRRILSSCSFQNLGWRESVKRALFSHETYLLFSLPTFLSLIRSRHLKSRRNV